jgi:hypothetical protein
MNCFVPLFGAYWYNGSPALVTTMSGPLPVTHYGGQQHQSTGHDEYTTYCTMIQWYNELFCSFVWSLLVQRITSAGHNQVGTAANAVPGWFALSAAIVGTRWINTPTKQTIINWFTSKYCSFICI